MKKLSRITDMMFCQGHMCRSGPAEVAHFDFELNEACAGASRVMGSFSGVVQMCITRQNLIMFTHVDFKLVRMTKIEFSNVFDFIIALKQGGNSNLDCVPRTAVVAMSDGYV